MAKILKCNCAHPAQDKMHGAQNRVHNSCKTTTKAPGNRCTVCGDVKGDKSAPVAEVEQANESH